MPPRDLAAFVLLSAALSACSSEAIDRGSGSEGATGGGGSGGSMAGSGGSTAARGGTGGSAAGKGGSGGGGAGGSSGTLSIPDYEHSPCYGEPAETLVYSLTTHETHTIQATCRAEGDFARVYVDDDIWQTQFDASVTPLDQSEIDAFMAGYELRGAPGSYRPDLGVLPTDELVFGDLPASALTDGKLPIFIIDSSGAGEGYLCSWCDQPQLHLDYLLLGSLHTDKTLSIAAHESFHAIHRAYDANEAPWVDESIAEAAMTVNGYFTDQSWLSSFLNNTNVNWGPGLSDVHDFNYGAGLLLGTYLWERDGQELMYAIVHEPADGWAGLDKALASVGDDADSWQLWGDLGLALFLDDAASGYEFKSFDLAGKTLPYAAATGQTLSETIAPYGFVFVTFETSAQRITLSTKGSVTARLVYDGAPADVRELDPGSPVALEGTPRVLLLTAKTATDFDLVVE
jgi:hypothetical protein